MSENSRRAGKTGAAVGFGPAINAVIGGLASALCVASPALGIPLVSALSLFAALPVFWIGLVHGPAFAAISALVAAVAMAVAASPAAAFASAAALLLPAVYMSHLLNLARPAEELGGPSGRMAWYPLADSIFRGCIAVAAGVILIGVVSGYDSATVAREIGTYLDQMAAGANPDVAAQLGSAEERASAVNLTVALLPFLQPFGLVVSLVASMYLAMNFAHRHTARPRDDMRVALRLPIAGLLAFGAAVALSFTGEPLGLVARVFAGALGAAFTIAGYAIVHLRLANSPAKLPILAAVYLLSIFFWPVFMALGLFSTARAVPTSQRKE